MGELSRASCIHIWRLKATNLVTSPMAKNMFMMEEELHNKMEMYVVYVYMVKWGSDFIPSDANSDHVSAKLGEEATPYIVEGNP